MRRRRLLLTLAATPGLALAGCLENERGRARIGVLHLINFDTEEYEVTVRVERQDETLLEETYVFHPHEEGDETDGWETTLDEAWESEGTYTITGRLHGGNEQSITISEEACHDVDVYTREGHVRVSNLHDERDCEATDD